MSKKTCDLLNCCLYFTANSLARVINRMAEEEFRKVGLAPSQAIMLTLACETPGISQKELAGHLHLAPSTVSRFIDTLERQGLIEKKNQGRNTFIHPTESGYELRESVFSSWRGLYERYNRVLGKEKADELTLLTAQAYNNLENGGQ